MDIGESLVGSYMRQVRGCRSIAYNTYVGHQAEVDVIAVRQGQGEVEVWVAEVAVHLEGLNYGGYERTVGKVRSKFLAARGYAIDVFPDATIHYEFWSPVVPKGLAERIKAEGVELVANNDFTDCVNQLALLASSHTRLTSDGAFRFLQLLTHLRGQKPRFELPT